MGDPVDLPGQAGYLSGSGLAMDGAFLGCLLHDRDSCGKGSPGLSLRLFINGKPDALNDVLYMCAV